MDRAWAAALHPSVTMATAILLAALTRRGPARRPADQWPGPQRWHSPHASPEEAFQDPQIW